MGKEKWRLWSVHILDVNWCLSMGVWWKWLQRGACCFRMILIGRMVGPYVSSHYCSLSFHLSLSLNSPSCWCGWLVILPDDVLIMGVGLSHLWNCLNSYTRKTCRHSRVYYTSHVFHTQLVWLWTEWPWCLEKGIRSSVGISPWLRSPWATHWPLTFSELHVWHSQMLLNSSLSLVVFNWVL